MTTSITRSIGASLAGLALVAALTGCSGDEPGTPPDAPPGSPSTSSTPATGSSSPADQDSASGPGSSDSARGNQALLAAAGTALEAVPDSTVISIETEHNDTQWEVQVVTADGTEHEVEVSGDGGTIVSGPREKSEDADDRAKHRDRVAAAKLSHADAVEAINDAVPGRITELNLDSENGATVWEADVIDSDDVKHEVTIDAGTGEVLEQD